MSNHEDIPEAKAAAVTKKDIPEWAAAVSLALSTFGLVSHSYLWYTSTALDWNWSTWSLYTYAPAVMWSALVGFVAAVTKKDASQDKPIPEWATNVNLALRTFGLVSHSYLWYTSTALDWNWSTWSLCTYAPAVMWSALVIPQYTRRKKSFDNNPNIPGWAKSYIPVLGRCLTMYAFCSSFYLWDTSTAADWGWGYWTLCTCAPMLGLVGFQLLLVMIFEKPHFK